MNKSWIIASLLCVLPAFVSAQTSAPAKSTGPEPADVPSIWMRDGKPYKHFMDLHDKFVKEAKKDHIDLLFLGDSITQRWSPQGKDVWQHYYGNEHAANFGIGGDRTQHVLWRIENGELDGIHPKVIVLMIGTNNLRDNTPESISSGIEKIVKVCRDKTGAKILLLGIFPRGKTEKSAAPLRDKIKQINLTIQKMDDGKNIRYLDLWDKFVEPNQDISKEMMSDYLHPTAKGYEVWAKNMEPLLKEMLGEK